MKRLNVQIVTLALIAQSVFSMQISYAYTAPKLPGHETTQSDRMKPSMEKLETELVAKYGEGQRARLDRGMLQVASFWRTEDGDSSVFEGFVKTNFAGDQATL